MSEVDVGIEGVAWLAFLGRCRSGDSFRRFLSGSRLSRIFSARWRLRGHHALILSDAKLHHFTGMIIPFSSPTEATLGEKLAMPHDCSMGSTGQNPLRHRRG